MRFMGIAGAVAAVGLLASGASALPAPWTSAPGLVPSAFSAPADNDHRWDRDHGRSWDGDRRGNDGWDGHGWRWWHDGGISADLCRDGGGHVVWRWWRHRCQGGRFDDFRVR